MSEVRNDSTDDRALLAVALGAEGGKHRGTASSAEEPEVPAHGKHRRMEHDDN
jgi:RNase adaptor protein for sRNA GlmZ degradation